MQETFKSCGLSIPSIVDLARLETEDFLLNKEQVDLPLISHLISSHIPYAINKDIDVELQSQNLLYPHRSLRIK